jgi:hypothetical protein
LRAITSFLIFFTATLIAACTPESRETLPESFRVAPDLRFVGTWRGGNEVGLLQGDQVVVQLKVDPAAPLDLLMTANETWRTTQGPHQRKLQARARFYNIVGRQIVAVQRLDADGKANGDEATWRFATYRFGGNDGMALYFMDEEQMRWRVNNGLLHGKIRGGEPQFPDVLLIEDSANIATIIRTVDPAVLFTARLGPFTRDKLTQ